MKKRILLALSCIFLLGTVLSLCTALHCDALTDGDFIYTVENDHATLTRYTGTSATPVIPDRLGGYTVYEIASDAFRNCTAIKEITLPSRLRTVGSYAFNGCTSLKKVVFRDYLRTIGDAAFWECSSLESISLPESLTTIGEFAFADCTALKTVYIPESVATVGWGAFASCTELTDLLCAASKKPAGWETDWTYETNARVHWSYTQHEHRIRSVAFVAPTCTENGNIAHYRCSVCTMYFSDAEGTDSIVNVTLPASGHSEQNDPAIAPTCTEGGQTAGKHCSVCNEILVQPNYIPPTGHTEVIDPAYEPTCTESGMTQGSHCAVCKAIIEVPTEIPATWHVTDTWELSKKPTATEPGEKILRCLVCNATVRSEVVPPLGQTSDPSATSSDAPSDEVSEETSAEVSSASATSGTETPQKSHTGLIVGAVIVAAVLIGVALALFLRKKNQTPRSKWDDLYGDN